MNTLIFIKFLIIKLRIVFYQFDYAFSPSKICSVTHRYTAMRSGPHKLDSAISAPRGYAAILATC